MRRNYQAIQDVRRASLVTAWLAESGGGRFVATDLRDRLESFRRSRTEFQFGVSVPPAKGLAGVLRNLDRTITAAGYRLTFTRTRTERFIELTRAKAMKKPKASVKAASPKAKERTKPRRPGPPCPKCKSVFSDVAKTMPCGGVIRRKRLCFDCGNLFLTSERSKEMDASVQSFRQANAITPSVNPTALPFSQEDRP